MYLTPLRTTIEPKFMAGCYNKCNHFSAGIGNICRVNKEDIFGKPCGMGHCFAERQNAIRALTLHQAYSFPFKWLKGSRLTVQGSTVSDSPLNVIASSLLSYFRNHLYSLCLTAACNCPIQRPRLPCVVQAQTPGPWCLKTCPSGRDVFVHNVHNDTSKMTFPKANI